MERVKPCQMCGKEIVYQRGNRKYCEDCAKIAAGICRKRREQERKQERPAKLCKICGSVVTERKRAYCEYCMTLTPEERAIRQETQHKKENTSRISITTLAGLARQYRYPYNSYGKLKSYIDRVGQLPSQDYRR